MADEAKKESKPTPADQGVPAQYLNEAGTAFRIGMDARLKSDLVNSALGLITKEEPGNSLNVFTEAEATKLLETRGWTSFLDRKKEILAAQEAKRAESTAKREAAARERATAKEQADKEKAEKKAAATAEASRAAKAEGEVIGDPKPGGKSKGRATAASSK